MKCHCVWIVTLLSSLKFRFLSTGTKKSYFTRQKDFFFPASHQRFRQQRYVTVQRLRSLRYVTALKVLVHYGIENIECILFSLTIEASLSQVSRTERGSRRPDPT
jgi:hypothetical protein